MPVAHAIGKNVNAIAIVSQLGIRNDRASPAPAIIMRIGKSEIERKCIISHLAVERQTIIAPDQSSHVCRKD
jgi:hypothetical protein